MGGVCASGAAPAGTPAGAAPVKPSNSSATTTAEEPTFNAVEQDVAKVETVKSTVGSRDINKVFEQFDADGNGTLDKKELKRALKALGIKNSKSQEEYFAKMDENNDGVVSKVEWNSYMPKDLRGLIEEKLGEDDRFDGFKPLADMARIFEQFDTDKSGALDKKEIKRAMAALFPRPCLPAHEETKAAVLAWVDENADADGNITIALWKQSCPKDLRWAISCGLNDRGLVENFVDDGRGKDKAEEKKEEAAPAEAAPEKTPAPVEEAPAAAVEEPAAVEEAAPAAEEAPAAAAEEAPAEPEQPAEDEPKVAEEETPKVEEDVVVEEA